MIRLEIRRGTTPHTLENRRHRALPRSKDSAGEEDFDMLPHRAGKHRSKDANGTAKGWCRNNVLLHFGLHSYSGSSTLLSQQHPLSEECGCLRSKHGVLLSEDIQSRNRTALASILPEPVRKGPPPLCSARSDQTGARRHPLHRASP